MRTKSLILLLAVFMIALFVRSWQLNSLPPGLNVDEVSEGYNAYSLIKTGKDRYGMVLPIVFKSYGSYQLPIYTYLTTLPVGLFGNTIFAVKFVSLISGLLVVIFTFLIIREFVRVKNPWLAYVAALTVAISPWAIFFSRIGTEASPSLALFVIGFYFCHKSVKQIKFFPLACLLLGLTTHTYYSERIVSVLFLAGFVFLFREYFKKNVKWLVLGVAVFALIQLPHLAILFTGAFTRRLDQVSYLGTDAYATNGIAFHKYPLGRLIFIVREFASQYTAYFSPRNLFFQPDDQGARAIPDLSVFYPFLVVPYFAGVYFLTKNYKEPFWTSLAVLLLVALVPAALTTDPFYSLRTLVYLWGTTLVIAVGGFVLLEKISSRPVRVVVVLAVAVVAFFDFYTHYFILFRHERSETVGYSSQQLIKITQERNGTKFVVDLTRDVALGIRFAYFRRYDPKLFQAKEGAPFLEKYYSSVDYEKVYQMDNVEIRMINWEGDVYKNQILVGDLLAISDKQVAEHKLKPEFEIKDLAGNVVLKAYSTNPREKCLSSRQVNQNCKKWL